jgi:septal ring factor EnvC (AmiA/AmiB activator)
MITTLGKLLVLLNAFVAVAVLSWALSANLNRQDSEQAVDESGEKLTDKVKRLNAELTTAQATFAPAVAAVGDGEAKLADYQARIRARLQESQTGEFYDLYSPVDQPQGPDAADPKAFARTRRLEWGQLPAARKIKGTDGVTPLRGVEAIQKELQDEGGKITAFTESIRKSVDAIGTLSTEIQGLNDRIARLRRILAAHESEIAALGDDRVNWDDRVGTLQKRNRQLQTRLRTVSGASAVGAAPASVVAPSALTLTPTR